MKRLTDLTPSQQQTLLETHQNLRVHTDLMNYQKYFLFMGEKIEYNSVINTQFLQG